MRLEEEMRVGLYQTSQYHDLYGDFFPLQPPFFFLYPYQVKNQLNGPYHGPCHAPYPGPSYAPYPGSYLGLYLYHPYCDLMTLVKEIAYHQGRVYKLINTGKHETTCCITESTDLLQRCIIYFFSELKIVSLLVNGMEY